MAYKIVITATKTDTKPWIFLQDSPEVDPELSELIAQLDTEMTKFGIALSTWVHDLHTLTLTSREFATKEECNAWSIAYFRDFDTTPYSIISEYHQDLTEKVEIIEI
jgi:hypothetical protein